MAILTKETARPASRNRSIRRMFVTAMATLLPLLPVAAGAASTGGIRPAVAKLLPANLKGVLHDKLPAAIRSKPDIVMATDVTIGKPFAWIGADSKVKGLAVDMADALGYVLGMKVKVVNTPFDDFIPSLQSGRADYSVSVMLDTKKRERVVNFVDYIVDGSSFLVATDSKLSDLTLAKLCGMTAGAIRGSVELDDLEKQTKACTSAGGKPITIDVYQGNSEMLLALVSGRIDVMMGASSELSYVKKSSHGKARSGGTPINRAVDGIVVSKTSGITTTMQTALQKLMDAGVYTKILALYGMQSNAVPKATVNKAKYEG